MGDNASVYVKSKCRDCKHEIQVRLDGRVYWEVLCSEMVCKSNPEGITKPKLKCDFFKKRRD